MAAALEQSDEHAIRDELWFGDSDPNRTEREAADSLAASIARVVGLKPFPASAWQVMGVLSSGNFRMSDVERQIQADPALASAVLRVANSPAFAGAEPVHSIQRALVRLGARTVRGVVATAATMGLFEDSGGLGARIRAHCAGTAGIAHRLAKTVSFRDPSTAFIAGLMHDIGKLLALQCGEVDYAAMPEGTLDRAGATHQLEREAVGYDHAVLGGHVLDHWGMPEPIPEVVALHHQPGRAWDHSDRNVASLVALIEVADAVEYAIASERDPSEVASEVARSGGASYLDLVALDLETLWPKFVSAREATLSML